MEAASTGNATGPHPQAELDKRLQRLEEDLAVLRACLEASGALRPEALAAQLHKRRFARVCASRPRGRPVRFHEAMQQADVFVAVAHFVGTGKWLAAAGRVFHEVHKASEMLAPAPSDQLLALGGWDGHQCFASVERYKPDLDLWEPWTAMRFRRTAFDAVVLQGRVYALGGHDNGEYCSELERYDPEHNAWRRLAPMHTDRCHFAAAALGGSLYVLGGQDSAARILDTVERYDLATGEWVQCRPMEVRRRDFRAASLGGHLYALGGHDGQRSLDKMDRYVPGADAWESLAPMLGERDSMAVAVHRHFIYVLGGFVDPVGPVRSAERYHVSEGARAPSGFPRPQEGRWEQLPPMRRVRELCAAAVVGGKVYVVGGADNGEYLSTVERYDPEKCIWEDVAPMTSAARAECCAVMVRQAG